ncbi:uncharacterized protein [Rutidosis leptorrhynchoides]|uniref:uncharacterized protein n=1 Tax=Rutidosis leptorrhynchoides TaxID=125765 RepID=UPI003A9A2C3F
MGRAPCCDKANVKKGPWSSEEDEKLREFINKHGTVGNWIALPHKAGLKRCGKSCRLRWLNYLRPNIKHGEFSEDEDKIICSLYANEAKPHWLYASIGSRWSIIAGQLPGRTDNDIKNYWNTKLRKKLMAMLPSYQKKPSFYPSINPLQSPNNFLNIASSSSFYNPNFINNVSNNLISTSSFIDNHIYVNDLIQPPPQPPSSSNSFSCMFLNNNYNLGFQDQDMNKEYYYPQVKERMLMFGGDQNSHKDHIIKQEDQFAPEGFGDLTPNYEFMTDHNNNFVDQKPKGYFKNLEELKQVIDIKNNSCSINFNINSYLMTEDNNDDENKTTHNNITDEYYMIQYND